MNYCRLYGELWRHLLPYVKDFRSKGFELGFSICRLGDEISVNETGAAGFGATLMVECDDGVREATIHSHITSDKSSLQDHITAIKTKIPASCITYEKGGDEYIKCYMYKKYSDEELDRDLKNMVEVFEKDREAYAELINHFDKKYFLCEEKI